MRALPIFVVTVAIVAAATPFAAGDERPRARSLRAAAPATTSAARPPARWVHEVPLAGDGREVIVEGTLSTPYGTLTGPMLVDTGSSYCVLTRATARRLGIHPIAAEDVPIATANGDVSAARVTLDALHVERAGLGAVDAVVMDAVEPPLLGIIGLSYLRHFRYAIDHRAGTFRLER